LDNDSKFDIKLYDENGKLVKDYGSFYASDINLPIELLDFNSGVYFLTLSGQKKNYNVKLPVIH